MYTGSHNEKRYKSSSFKTKRIPNAIAIDITEDLVVEAAHEGWRIAKDSKSAGMQPYSLGGDVISHIKGKLAELIVEGYFRSRKIPVVMNCFKRDYTSIPESYDAVI